MVYGVYIVYIQCTGIFKHTVYNYIYNYITILPTSRMGNPIHVERFPRQTLLAVIVDIDITADDGQSWVLSHTCSS
jgi:hypothetical protein